LGKCQRGEGEDSKGKGVGKRRRLLVGSRESKRGDVNFEKNWGPAWDCSRKRQKQGRRGGTRKKRIEKGSRRGGERERRGLQTPTWEGILLTESSGKNV